MRPVEKVATFFLYLREHIRLDHRISRAVEDHFPPRIQILLIRAQESVGQATASFLNKC